MDEYARDFVQESEENVTELNNALLELEREPGNEEAMDRIFRMAHTLKGNAGAMGFDEASDLAHAIEDLLDAVRADQIAVSAELMDDVFSAVDQFEGMIDDVREHGEIRTDPSDTIERLRAVETAATGAPSITDPSEEDLDAAMRAADALDEPDHTVYHVRLAVLQQADVNNAALVVDALDDAFDLLGTVPPREDVDTGETDGRIDAAFGSAVPPASIEAALEPVDAVDDWIISDVTDRYEGAAAEPADGAADAAAARDPLADDPATELGESEAMDMPVDELLGEFDEYDDLDALVEEMDDVSGFDDLGEAGSFDDLDLGEDLEPADEPAADPLAGDDGLDLGGDGEMDLAGDDDLDLGGDGAESPEQAGDAAGDEEVEDAAETFAELKQEVDPVGFDELQNELDELEFDEYSDEEEVGFDELLGDDFEEGEGDFFDDEVEAGAVDDVLVDEDADVPGFDEAEPPEATGERADAPSETATADSPAEAASPTDADSSADPADAATAEPDDVESGEGPATAGEPASAEDPASAGEPASADAGFEDTETAAVGEEFGEGDFGSAPDVDGFDDAESAEAGGDFGGDFELDEADPSSETTFDDVGSGFGDDEPFDASASDMDDFGGTDLDADDLGAEPFGDDEELDLSDDVDEGVDTTAGPLAGADADDLEDVEVDEFSIDEPAADAGVTDDVETGDFGTPDLEPTGTDATADSDVDYGSVETGGFDEAPEDAAGADAPDGEMAPDEARELIEQTLPRADDDGGDSEVQSVRVDVEQIDTLLNLVEGLVTNRVRLRRSVEEGASAQQLNNDLDDLEDVTGDLQDTVMDIRLVPLKMVANTLPRVVRDVSRDQGKEVEFEMEGEDVEMDRTILDEISDPLVHLVRNAVDHGIEAPGEREAADKPETGHVTLRAERARDRVLIEVEDDGRGLDPDVLREEAVDEGILDEDEAASLSDREAHELVFHPGLSTASEVTDVSGRGVGMDVVKSTVEDLDGEVEVESEDGAGTTIRLVLPVSVAIDDVLFVECGDEEFGVPTKVVRDIGSPTGVEQNDDREVVRTDDGEEIPLIRLGDALQTPGPKANGGGMLLHVRRDVRDVVLHCDSVQGQQEVVVKPYDDVLGDIPGLSGATVLGEGEVVNILDVKSL